MTVIGEGAVTGELLGPYLLRGRLGEGGMGVVRLATAPDGRLVALKELRPGVLAGEDARARLAREVAALQRVRGAGVAEVLDADVTGSRPYVVTRHVTGLSLDRFVERRGPLSPALQLRLATGLADALATVHAAGVVHRDIKPGNVMLADGGGVVIVDFGLARAIDATRLTSTGILVGTPGYLAPETVVGHWPTAATDVHGWAATVAYAASGRAPYGEGPVVAVLDRIRRGDHALQGLEPALATLVVAGLADDPGARPALPDLRRRLAELAASRDRSDATATSVLALAPRTVVDLPVQTGAAAAPPAPPAALAPRPASPPPRAGDPPSAAITPWRGYPFPPAAPQGPATPPPELAPVSRSAPTAWPVELAEPPPPRGSALVVLLSTGALLVAGFAAAPYVALGALALVLLAARTTDRLRLRLLRRRLERGPQPHDVRAVAREGPWRALVALPATALQAAWAGIVALAAGTLTSWLWDGPHAPFYVAGVAAVLTAWWGPGSASVRQGARAAVAPVRRAGSPAWASAFLLLAVAWLLAVVAEQYPPLWWPGGSGPSLPPLPGWWV